ncbi:MAG: transmembrane 220 family protein [Halioglobus sp.]|nr:transmembrane 220 family protein [Halioglobus sp.]
MAIHILNGLFLAAYLLSALVQFNDPDPFAWVLVYIAAAWMCVAQFRNRQPRWLPAALLLLTLGWMATLLPALTGDVSWADIFDSVSMKTRAVEEAREIGGLALIALWAAVLALHTRRRSD